MLIFNASTTNDGGHSVRPRHSLDEVNGVVVGIFNPIQVPWPMVVKEYFTAFPIIDIHDHYRQGTLVIERRWLTTTWWHRLFGTIWGQIVANAYFAYRLEYRLAQNNIVKISSYLQVN